MKVAELTGVMLDLWVARAIGLDDPKIYQTSAGVDVCEHKAPGVDGFEAIDVDFKPSEDWSDCGPLIWKYRIDLDGGSSEWMAGPNAINKGFYEGTGDTPQQAICRAVVRSVYGDDVEDEHVSD